MRGEPLNNTNGHHWMWSEADLLWCPRCLEVYQMDDTHLSDPCQEPPVAQFITSEDMEGMAAQRPQIDPWNLNHNVVMLIPSGYTVKIWPSGEVFLREGPRNYTYLLDLNYHTVREAEAS